MWGQRFNLVALEANGCWFESSRPKKKFIMCDDKLICGSGEMANASVLEADTVRFEGSSPSFRTKHDMSDEHLQYWASEYANIVLYGRRIACNKDLIDNIIFDSHNFTQHDIEEIKQRAKVILWFKDANNR